MVFCFNICLYTFIANGWQYDYLLYIDLMFCDLDFSLIDYFYLCISWIEEKNIFFSLSLSLCSRSKGGELDIPRLISPGLASSLLFIPCPSSPAF